MEDSNTIYNKVEYAAKKVKDYNKLLANRTPLEEEWQKIAEFMCPQKANILKTSSKPSEMQARLFDTTASDALLIAAGGLLSWTTPKNIPWFAYEPVTALKNSTAVKKWFGECTQLAQEYLANSNFYTVRHESLIDKLAFGTSCIYSQWDDKTNRVFFTNLEAGTYVIAENEFGIVDTVMCIHKYTARQAVMKFGLENLPQSVQENYKNNKFDSFDEYLYVVEPRDDTRVSTAAIARPDQKPIAACYIHMKTKTLVRESGYDTMPMHCGRWLAWHSMYHSWGYGPGFAALPEARQLNYYQKMMDIYMGKATFPPMLVPDSYEGILDTQAKGINYYNPQVDAAQFSQLPVIGDVNIGINRIEFRKRAVESKFHTDLWQMIANRDQQKTATEVMELVNEKVEALSPAFDRDVSEVIEPMMIRLFNMWASKGMLPPPPEEAIINVEQNIAEVPNPTVTMTSKLALAIKAARNASADRQIARLAQVASINPSVLDVIDFDAYAKGTSFNAGMPVEYIKNDDQIAEERQARAQAAQQQQQAQMMIEGAKAIGPQNVKELVQGAM